MNLRISNLSFNREMDITATDSAQLFDGIALSTTTDKMLNLVPRICKVKGPSIEGSLRIKQGDIDMVFSTCHESQQVIVKHKDQLQIRVPFNGNLALEWDEHTMALSGY